MAETEEQNRFPIISQEEAKANPEYYRAIYQRFVLQGETWEEIAAALETSVESVERDIERVKNTLLAEYPNSMDFILSIEGFRGFELVDEIENEEEIKKEIRNHMSYIEKSGCNERDVFYRCARFLVGKVDYGEISLKDYMKLFEEEAGKLGKE